jgi:hypothetical protein
VMVSVACPHRTASSENQPNLELELVPEICEVLLVSGKGSEDEMDFLVIENIVFREQPKTSDSEL